MYTVVAHYPEPVFVNRAQESIPSLAESIPRLLKRLQIRPPYNTSKISTVNIANQWGENQQTLPSPYCPSVGDPWNKNR